MFYSSSAVELVQGNATNVPCCEHGPALLFRRIGTNGKNEGRAFYACSAYRDRKKCNMFIWEDEALKSLKSKTWQKASERALPSSSHSELHKLCLTMSQYPAFKRIFCCRKLQRRSEAKGHNTHSTRIEVTDTMLRRPSQIVTPDTANSSKAQYYFSSDCVKFVGNLLKVRRYEHVVCIGTPTIHEYLLENDMDSLLLDIEQSYEYFYNEDTFCWYNMFNHFFFRGNRAERALTRRLQDGTSCAVIMDPPFGGRIDAIALTLKKICATASDVLALNVLLFFPYFNEKHIGDSMPFLHMLDYKVNYTNHADFNETRAKGSPVRIFTDIPLSEIALPCETYTHCHKCDRWVDKNNKHCDICRNCTGKDGGRYKHCKSCGLCVKQSYRHCDECAVCRPPGHSCTQTGVMCFLCKRPGHKSQSCPERRRGKSLVETRRKKKKVK